jgi:hypothetical protein
MEVPIRNTTLDVRRALLLFGLVGLASTGFPCGDKLMVVSRGQRTAVGHNAPHRGAILLYAPPGGSVAAALTGADLKKGLERAGHRVRTVATRADLKNAIGTGSYDLVLTDLKAVSEVEVEAKGAPSSPTIIPTLFDPSPADLKAASSELHCVVKSKGSQTDYLSVVNDALTQRAKAQEARKASKKS